MPRIIDQPPQAPAPVGNPDFQITGKLLSEYRDLWLRQHNEYGLDPVLFSRLSVVAMGTLVATIGVDVGMSREQYMNVCGANYDAAFARAPKFG